MTPPDAERPSVFVSYSHQDRNWLARLRVHLKPLERDFAIDIWDDTRIDPGAKWKDEIKRALESAKVAVLLVSADFLGSDFIASDELPPLLSAAEVRGTRIIPLHLSPSRFRKTPSLAQFQSINDPATPLINVPVGEQEAVFVKLADALEAHLVSRSTETTKPSLTTLTSPSRGALGAPDVLPVLVRETLEEIRQEVAKVLEDHVCGLGNQIASSVFVDGLRAIAHRAHPKRLAGNLEQALEAALAAIKKGSRPLYEGDEWRTLMFTDTEPLSKLVTAVAGNKAVTDEIVKAMKEVSTHGPIHVREPFGDWRLDIRPGLQLDCGVFDETFINRPERGAAHVHRPYIFIANHKISRPDEVAAIIRHDQEYDIGGIVIIAKDFERAVIETLPRELKLIRNREYGAEHASETIEAVLAIKAPDTEEQRDALFADLCVVTGARTLGGDRGRSPGKADLIHLGRATRVLSTQGHTTIIEGGGSTSAVESRIAELVSAMERTTHQEQRRRLEDRIHRLRAAIAVIDVGKGFVDVDERKRVWPLLFRSLRALEHAGAEGVVAGDGLALANAGLALREQLDLKGAGEAVAILARALEMPIKSRAEEVGRNGDDLLRDVRERQTQTGNANIGYHSDEDAFVDLFSAGVVAPTTTMQSMVRLSVELVLRRLKAIRFNDELVQQMSPPTGA